jgi:hypothetical protein
VCRVKEAPADTPPKELTVTLTNAERPFLLWLFARPNQSLETLLRALSSASAHGSGAAKWEVLLSRSRPEHAMTLDEFELARNGQGRPVFGSLERMDDGSDLAPVWLAKIFGQRPLPLNFDVPVPMEKIEETNEEARLEATLRAAQTNLNVSLACWNILQTQSGKAKPPQVALERLRLDPVKPEFRLGTDSRWEGKFLKVRLLLPVARPAGAAAYQAWMVTLTTPPSPELERLWSEFSTEDDSSPAAGGQIYNLKAVLEDIYRECLVFDRKVFLTYWP